VTNLIEAPKQERAAEDELALPATPKPTRLPTERTRWRVVRLAVAIPLLAVSFAALFPFAVLPVSTQAVVNARLSEVKAPADGKLGTISLETGDTVVANQPLASSALPSATAHTASDTRSRTELQQESARLGASLTASQMEKARYDGMYNQFLQHIAGDLDMQLHEAEREQTTAQARAATAGEEVKRDQQALADHLIPRSLLDRALEKQDTAQHDADAKSSAVRRLQKQISDARAGYVLDPSQAPPFLTARDNAAAEIDRLREQKAAVDAELMLPGQLTTASVATPRTTIVSPVSGTIWSRSVATGQTVSEGDDLFRIADANSIHVEVWLDRRYGPQLSIGDTALVYLSGLGKELAGHVTSFEGTSRRRLDEEVNAIDLQPVHPDQYHVSIELEPQDRKSIYIGQAAKVLFPGSRHRLRASIYFWLTRM